MLIIKSGIDCIVNSPIVLTMGALYGKIVVTEEQMDIFSKTSGMEKEKVRKHCQEFLRVHPKGRMSKSEFIKFANIALQNSRKINMKGMAEHIFWMYDLDQDGFVTFIEFMVVYHIMVNGNTEENLGKVFLIFDVNNDGVITQEEMNVLVRHISLLVEGDDEFDKSDDVAKEAFNKMDKDKNGEITKEEFVLTVLDQEKFSKFLTLKVIEIFV
jgi:Ca2+-binding EF-hand superfamily protein